MKKKVVFDCFSIKNDQRTPEV